MLHSEATAYVLAVILLFIIGLIIFCCCRIWYDLLGCGDSRRGQNRSGGRYEAAVDGVLITDNDESRFKPISNFDGGGCGNGGSVHGGSSRHLAVGNCASTHVEASTSVNGSTGGGASSASCSTVPVMRIVITNADEVEQESNNLKCDDVRKAEEGDSS